MARITNLAGRPIEQYSSPNIGGTMSDHRGLVLHIAEGFYRGTISWQMNPDQRYKDGTRVTTSSTWIVGREPGEWAQMADSDTVAWCQGAGSRTWNSVELAGFAPDGPSAWQIEACAQLLAWLHRQYKVPLQVAAHPGERGLGHHSMDREWLGEQWGHDSCPGAGVIAAKEQMVRRAIEIVNGDDDMGMSDNDRDILIYRVEALTLGLDRVAAGPQKGEEVKLVGLVKKAAADLAELKARPPAQSAPVDVEALAEKLKPALEAAVRRVLGAVDGATPQG